MKKYLPYLKNKFVLTSVIFVLYSLFLDDYDIFTIISQNRKLSKLEIVKTETRAQLEETKSILNDLKYPSEIERFAREKKFFKKDDEDIFVVFYQK